MTRVIFYTDVAAPLGFLRRFLTAKVCRAGKTALVFCGANELSRLDEALWETGFIPHALLGSAAAEGTPVLLSDVAPAADYSADMLILWQAKLPDFVGRFPVYVDIIGSDDAAKRGGRRRYQFFKTHGYPIEHIPSKS